MSVAGDFEFGQPAFNDLDAHHAVLDPLVGDHGAGVEIPALNVVHRQLTARFLKLLGGDSAIFVGRGDNGKFFIGKHGVAGEFDALHKNLLAGGQGLIGSR